MANPLLKLLTSLRLTVVCLALSIVLVFIGTLAQVNEGLYQAQGRYFRSFFIWWGPDGANWKVPIFPGGYLVGIVLLVNLVLAHFQRFQLTRKKLGIHLTHFGIILLLVGQLTTDLFSVESHLRFREGESKNYSESHLENEVAILTDSDRPGLDRTMAIPESLLVVGEEIRPPDLPFTLRVKEYHVNSRLAQRAPMVDKDPPAATQGIGTQARLIPQPPTYKTDERNLPSTVVEVVGTDGTSLGTWLLSPWLSDPQPVTVQGKTYRLAFRWKRIYTDYSIALLKTTHEVYPGSDIPKNFQSRVRIENPTTKENREVDIFMNNPLRYQGLTYYQYQMGRDEVNSAVGTSTLQVVRNPSWLTPYLGCIIVAAGLTLQFMTHLIGFLHKRRTA